MGVLLLIIALFLGWRLRLEARHFLRNYEVLPHLSLLNLYLRFVMGIYFCLNILTLIVGYNELQVKKLCEGGLAS